VEERNLTSGAFLEETKNPEIGFAYQLHSDSAVTERTLLASEDGDVFGVTTVMKQSVVCWSVKPVGEPDAGNPHVRFDEREVETEHGRRILRHTRGNPDPEVSRSLTHRATSRLYPINDARCPQQKVIPLTGRSDRPGKSSVFSE